METHIYPKKIRIDRVEVNFTGREEHTEDRVLRKGLRKKKTPSQTS